MGEAYNWVVSICLNIAKSLRQQRLLKLRKDISAKDFNIPQIINF